MGLAELRCPGQSLNGCWDRAVPSQSLQMPGWGWEARGRSQAISSPALGSVSDQHCLFPIMSKSISVLESQSLDLWAFGQGNTVFFIIFISKSSLAACNKLARSNAKVFQFFYTLGC